MFSRVVVATVAGLMAAPLAAQAQGSPAAASAVFTGRILIDATQVAIANAEVALPALAVTGLTDDKGEFRLTGILPGSYRVVVRHMGYTMLDTRVTFVENQASDRTLYLERITLLDSVTVNARHGPPDHLLEEFAARKARGVGTFLTRADLDKKRGSSLPAIASQMQGLNIIYGRGSQAWVLARRAPMPPSCSSFRRTGRMVDRTAFVSASQCYRKEGWYLPDDGEAGQGMKLGCYALVYIDRLPMNPFGDPFNLSTMDPSQIEAIEWYSSNAQTPPEYSTRSSACGVMIIHSRRTPGM